MDIVEIEARERINRGFRDKHGEDMTDEQWTIFCLRSGLGVDHVGIGIKPLRMNPATHTFSEIEDAIQGIKNRKKHHVSAKA